MEQWINGKKGMEKIIDYMQKKSNCTTEYRNGKTTEKHRRSRRKKTNQDGDENEERRRKTNEDARAMDYKFKNNVL
jgi:hypothetical protein